MRGGHKKAYTHGGTHRGKNVKGHGIGYYTKHHRLSITGHVMNPPGTHTKRAT